MRRHRGNRQRRARGHSVVGQEHVALVGPVAHGGHCVARVPVGDAGETRVVFVRHALPGEQVRLRITEGTAGDRFWRADAIAVLRAAPERVSAPCEYAGPDGCGGCDFQHVAVTAQRVLKADVVREQLVRLGGLDLADPLLTGLVVEAVPGDRDGLGWRTRQRYAEVPGQPGTRGMRKHRSHEVVPIDQCLIEAPGATTDSESAAPGERVEVVESEGGARSFRRAADGFWQVHPGAPATLVGAVLSALDPQPGERALDLYAGVGLFAAFLADALGGPRQVAAVEGDLDACRYARLNVGEGARIKEGSVPVVLASEFDEPFDLVVLDPPREGARKQVVEQVVDRAPRAVAYVACDPAALARDVKTFAEHGYRLTALRAFDLFPMTHHVECVALLER